MPFPSHEKTQEQEGGGDPIVPFPPTVQEQSRFSEYPIICSPPSTFAPTEWTRQGTRQRSGLKCAIAGNNGGPVGCLGIGISNLIFRG